MRHFGASEGILRVIQGLIQLTQYRCRAGKLLSEPLPLTMQRGFKEGCPASPVEFNFLQEGILRTWRQKMAEHGPSSKLAITCGTPQDTDHATTRSLPGPTTVGSTCGRDFSVARDRAGPPVLRRRHEHAAQRGRGGTPPNVLDKAHGTVGRHSSPRTSGSTCVVGARLLWESWIKGKIPEPIPMNPEEEALRDENMAWDTAIEMVGSWLTENGDTTRDLSETTAKSTQGLVHFV